MSFCHIYHKGCEILQQDDKSSPPVWAEVNLDRLRHNLTVINKRLKTGTKIMAVVKANAYGHGAVKIATELEKMGIDYFAVATVLEGVELRLCGIKGTVLLLEMLGPEQLNKVIDYNLTPTVYSLEEAELLGAMAEEVKRKIKIHLRIDTGIGGLGIRQQDIKELVLKMKRFKYLETEGLYTHLTSDYRGDEILVCAQMERFLQIRKELEGLGIKIPLVHVASSLGALTKPEAHFNMVRIGIALYGIPPAPGLEKLGLQAVMQLKSRIGSLKLLEANEQIGTYHDLFTATKPIKYAIIPIGYADAFFLLSIRKGELLIKGQRASIIGQARMNQILADVTGIPDVAVGDEVVIIGEQGDQRISAQEATLTAGIAAMNCESVCLVSSRVPRVYTIEKNKIERIDSKGETAIAVGGVND